MELSLDAVRTTTPTWPASPTTTPFIGSQHLREVTSRPCACQATTSWRSQQHPVYALRPHWW
eukprot:12393541-Prorocentrum_lima.AAC.1